MAVAPRRPDMPICARTECATECATSKYFGTWVGAWEVGLLLCCLSSPHKSRCLHASAKSMGPFPDVSYSFQRHGYKIHQSEKKGINKVVNSF